MNRVIPKLKNRKVSSRETQIAFEKFEWFLTARQRAIVYQSLVSQEIAEHWGDQALYSETYMPSTESPNFHCKRNRGSEALRISVNAAFDRAKRRHLFDKTDERKAKDRALAERLREIRRERQS